MVLAGMDFCRLLFPICINNLSLRPLWRFPKLFHKMDILYTSSTYYPLTQSTRIPYSDWDERYSVSA